MSEGKTKKTKGEGCVTETPNPEKLSRRRGERRETHRGIQLLYPGKTGEESKNDSVREMEKRGRQRVTLTGINFPPERRRGISGGKSPTGNQQNYSRGTKALAQI